MKPGKLILPALITLFVLSANGQQIKKTEGSLQEHVLMPIPASVRFGAGRMALTSAFTIGASEFTDSRLAAACDRAARRLERRTGLEFSRAKVSDPLKAGLVVRCQRAGNAVPSLGEDESYSIVVSPNQAVLQAATVVGALRGLETFLQLVESDYDGYFLPGVTIRDEPRFAWRGLLLDAGRHFMPVDLIKRELDGMAAVKLNVLHWHLTEDQGFRVECRKYPKLHEMGSDGLFYTQDQIRDVIAYARDRGIRVVPEFDMPGHSTSWFVGYPELASAPGPYQIERTWGIMDPAFDPSREEVYTFIDGFIGEMASLFPDDYIHIGGDESNGEHWKKNPSIQAFMREKGIKDDRALQKYFTLRVAAIVAKHGKKVAGWDEILDPELPKNIVVDSWRGQSSLAEGAKNGYSGILSFGYYLDLMLSTSYHYGIDPLPPDSGLTEEQSKRVLGGEASMWSEYVSEETVDSRIWPRLAAVAERLWSPRSVNDVEDMYRRLASISVRLEDLGLAHESNKGRMLRRLTGSENIAALKTLVDVVEPLKVYKRGEALPTTQLSPLTRLVDVARADSDVARSVASMVDNLLSDAPRFQANQYALVQVLKEWRDVRPELDATINRSAILRDAEPLARDLSEIGTTGLEAMSYLTGGAVPKKEWRDARLAFLAQAAKPRAAVEFAIIQSVKQLVIAAAELPELRTTPSAEWKTRVKTLASGSRPQTGT
jgi:hexosaminidase